MTPQLRFPEFADVWQAKKLGDLLSVGSGRDYKHLKDGEVPVYGTGGLMTHVDDYLHDGASVAIGRKGTIDQPQFLTGKFWTVDTLFYTHNYKDTTPEFVYLLFQGINWQKWNEASGVPSLSSSTIKTIKTAVPPLEEQQKIADFLIAVDDKISALEQKAEKLETYKRGVMQKIFSRRIRFTRSDDPQYPEWETKKLGNIFKEVTRKVGDKVVETYSITAGKGFISQAEKFGRDISGAQNERYTLLHQGELSYNKGNSKTFAYGCVYANNTGKPIAVPNVFISFKPKNDNAIVGFYEQLFVNHYLDRHLRKIISSGARMDGLLNVNKKDFFDIFVPMPSREEQQKIADLLSAIDQKITLTAQQLEKTKEFKKGLLQRMFV